MKKKQPNWTNKKKFLTKAEMKHLAETTKGTKQSFQINIKMHKKWRKEFPKTKPCWTCRDIARKLEIEAE